MALHGSFHLRTAETGFMRLKLLIGFLAGITLCSFQKEEDIWLTVGNDEGCLNRDVDIPVTVKMADELIGKGDIVLNANGIVLSAGNETNKTPGVNRYIGRVAAGKEVTIVVSFRKYKKKEATLVYKRLYPVCPK